MSDSHGDLNGSVGVNVQKVGLLNRKIYEANKYCCIGLFIGNFFLVYARHTIQGKSVLVRMR